MVWDRANGIHRWGPGPDMYNLDTSCHTLLSHYKPFTKLRRLEVDTSWKCDRGWFHVCRDSLSNNSWYLLLPPFYAATITNLRKSEKCGDSTQVSITSWLGPRLVSYVKKNRKTVFSYDYLFSGSLICCLLIMFVISLNQSPLPSCPYKPYLYGVTASSKGEYKYLILKVTWYCPILVYKGLYWVLRTRGWRLWVIARLLQKAAPPCPNQTVQYMRPIFKGQPSDGATQRRS